MLIEARHRFDSVPMWQIECSLKIFWLNSISFHIEKFGFTLGWFCTSNFIPKIHYLKKKNKNLLKFTKNHTSELFYATSQLNAIQLSNSHIKKNFWWTQNQSEIKFTLKPKSSSQNRKRKINESLLINTCRDD